MDLTSSLMSLVQLADRPPGEGGVFQDSLSWNALIVWLLVAISAVVVGVLGFLPGAAAAVGRALTVAIVMPLLRLIAMPSIVMILASMDAKKKGIKVRRFRLWRWLYRPEVSDYLRARSDHLSDETLSELARTADLDPKDHPACKRLLDTVKLRATALLPASQAAVVAVRTELRPVGGQIDELAKKAEGIADGVEELLRRPSPDARTQNPSLRNNVDVVERSREARWTARPFRDWLPRELGVHDAVTASPGASAEARSETPEFVLREHDAQLRSGLVGEGADGAPDHPTFIAIWGGSCAGKSRTAFEAVAASPLRGWGLVRPVNLAELLDVLERGIPPRTILWLDDLEDYFGQGLTISGNDHVGRAVLYLSKLLNAVDLHPLVVITTTWTLPVASSTPGGGSSTTTNPQEVDPSDTTGIERLFQLATTIHVPDAFDYDAVQDAAARNPHFRRALEDISKGRARHDAKVLVTQYLAGGAHHLQAYHSADPAVHAVITAAMDLRRVGMVNPIPGRLIEDAAKGYLPEGYVPAMAEWAHNALMAASAVWRNTYALTPHEELDGTTSYDLHDFLLFSHISSARLTATRQSLWEALAQWRSLVNAATMSDIVRDGYARGLLADVSRLIPEVGNRPNLAATIRAINSERAYKATVQRALRSGRLKPRYVDDSIARYTPWGPMAEAAAARGQFNRPDVRDMPEMSKRVETFAFHTGDRAILSSLAQQGSYSAATQLVTLLRAGPDLAQLEKTSGESGPARFSALEAFHAYLVATDNLEALTHAAKDMASATKLFDVLVARGRFDELFQRSSDGFLRGELRRAVLLFAARGERDRVAKLLAMDRTAANGRTGLLGSFNQRELEDLVRRGCAPAVTALMRLSAFRGDLDAIERFVTTHLQKSGDLSSSSRLAHAVQYAVGVLLARRKYTLLQRLATNVRDLQRRLFEVYLVTNNTTELSKLLDDPDIRDNLRSWRTPVFDDVAIALAALGQRRILEDRVNRDRLADESLIYWWVYTRDRERLRRIAESGSPQAPFAKLCLGASRLTRRRAIRDLCDASTGADSKAAALASLVYSHRLDDLERIGVSNSEVQDDVAKVLFLIGQSNRVANIVEMAPKLTAWMRYTAIPALIGRGCEKAWILRIVSPSHVGEDASGRRYAVQMALCDRQDVEVLRELAAVGRVPSQVDGQRDSPEAQAARTWEWALQGVVEDAGNEAEVNRGLEAGESWAAEARAERLRVLGDVEALTGLAKGGDFDAWHELVVYLHIHGDAAGLISLREHTNAGLSGDLYAIDVLLAQGKRRDIQKLGAASVDRTNSFTAAYRRTQMYRGEWDQVTAAVTADESLNKSEELAWSLLHRGQSQLLEELARQGDGTALKVLALWAIGRGDEEQLRSLVNAPHHAASQALLDRAVAKNPGNAPYTLDVHGYPKPCRRTR